jgi:trk system potassium uptake protein TrkH
VNHRFVIYSVGRLLQLLAIVMLVPAAIAVWESWPLALPQGLADVRIAGFAIAIGLSFILGTVLALLPRDGTTGNLVREGFAIVTFGWLVLTLLGSIPLFIYLLLHDRVNGSPNVLLCFTNAYFEIMSGFTTTGATIMRDIEVLPKGILFWRSMTHWLGGMGIVTLVLAIFPAFGMAAYQMFRAEVPGPTTERLKPHMAQTATILWGVYALLTVAETVLLMVGGMSMFEAFCHAFGTMATGGFSTRNASIAAYHSDFIDWVIILFMFFAGMNFMIHYRIIFAGRFSLLRTNSEFRFYATVIVAAVLLGTALVQARGLGSRESITRSYRSAPLTETELDTRIEDEARKVRSWYGAFRHVAFQTVSMTTTTGYCTADFDMWPTALRLGLVVLMFFGGCAGSTGGGMKMVRIMVVLKSTWREVRTMVQPRLIAPVKVGGKAIEETQVANILAFVALFVSLFIGFSMLMSFMVPDVTTAVSTVVSTMCNIGPGLSGIGATENYAWIALPGKWILTLCMLVGRLEVYTVVIAFAPISWRR